VTKGNNVSFRGIIESPKEITNKPTQKKNISLDGNINMYHSNDSQKDYQELINKIKIDSAKNNNENNNINLTNDNSLLKKIFRYLPNI